MAKLSDAIKLEREKRATAREERLWNLLSNPVVIESVAVPLTMGATYYAGKSRLIQRDLAGALFGLEGVLAAARHGVDDRYALLGIWGALTGVYAATVRPSEDETIIELQPFGGDSWSGGTWSDIKNFLLGSDQKLFGIPMP